MANFRFENTKPAPTNAELIADLQNVAARLEGSRLSQNAYRRLGAYSSTVMKTRFGSWNQALKAAALPAEHRPNLSIEELFANIVDVWTALGRQPRKRDMNRPLSKFTADPYVTRFGGWLPAMKAFVDYTVNDSGSVISGAVERKVSHGPRDPSLRLRFRVLSRDNFRCCQCGRSPATHLGLSLHVDHVRSWEQGGPTTYENLQTLCAECNLGKSNLSVPTCGERAATPRILGIQRVTHDPRLRLRTVPRELPMGSGDAALASPAVVPEFGKSMRLESRV